MTTTAAKTADQYREECARLRDFSLEQLHPDLPLRFPSFDDEDVPETFRAQLVRVSRLGWISRC